MSYVGGEETGRTGLHHAHAMSVNSCVLTCCELCRRLCGLTGVSTCCPFAVQLVVCPCSHGAILSLLVRMSSVHLYICIMIMFLLCSGHGVMAPLLAEMLHSIQTEFQRYERIVNYWPVYAPMLEAAICTVLRAVTAAITRQCGLMPSRPVASFNRTPAR